MLSNSRQGRFAAALLAIAGLTAYAGVRIAARPGRDDASRARIGRQRSGVYLVPTGQTIRPAGKLSLFDGRPVEIALSPDGRTLALMQVSGIRLFDTRSRAFRGERIPGHHDLGGICWSPDGRTLYSTGATKFGGKTGLDRGCVFVTHLREDGTARESAPIRFLLDSRIHPNKRAETAFPGGLALSPSGGTLYVSLFNNGTVALVDLGSYNEASGAASYREIPVGSSPGKLVVSRDGTRVYVANRGGRPPVEGDTVDAEDPVVVDPRTYRAASGTLSVIDVGRADAEPGSYTARSIDTGLQPADLALSPDGSRLYTANANSDTVSVINTASDSVVETIPVSPAPGRLAASCPNGLVVARDGRTLYVSLGGDNAIEPLELSKAAGGAAPESRIAGLIPTAWFPVAVALTSDGASLIVASSKGVGSLGKSVAVARPADVASPQAGPGGVTGPQLTGHSVYSVLGSLSVLRIPSGSALRGLTAQAAENNHFEQMAHALSDPIDPYWSRFKHVILVIKENRTYDQVFGDVAVGPGHVGGDPELVMFGRHVTPNHHALASHFGLFDNLYCSGAISADGHHWLNEAFASDYSERGMDNYPRSYPCCGTDPLVFAGNKFLWEAALDEKRTFFNYGELGPLPSIAQHSDSGYDDVMPVVSANMNRDVAHTERVLRDMESNARGGLADLTFMWLSNDHTSGTMPGTYSPEACVADNDLALGRLVDAVSHSKRYWHDEPTALFVVEDDAQGGLDHVDGHRTVGLVISPFNRRGQVFSSNFNQLDMVRTIELILGLKPLNQFDAAARSMRICFDEKADYAPFTALPNEVPLNKRNPPLRTLSGLPRRLALESARLDFSSPDRADPEKLTEILWKHCRAGAPYPPASAAIR